MNKKDDEMNWDGLNRRSFPRVSYPCLVKIKDAKDKDMILTHTENISAGGVGIIVKNNIKTGTELQIQIDLMDTADHILCNGKVVWVVRRKGVEDVKPNFYDVGVEFIDLPEKDNKRIKEIVDRLVKKR